MSDDTQRIRECIIHDWQTTAQILERSGIQCLNRHCGIAKVFRTLDSDRRYGLVEKRTVEAIGRGGRASVWRLVA